MKYILNKEVTFRHDEYANTFYVFCSNSGDCYEINNVGYDILSALKNGLEAEAICGFIVDKYAISNESAREDITEFIDRIIELGLIMV